MILSTDIHVSPTHKNTSCQCNTFFKQCLANQGSHLSGEGTSKCSNYFTAMDSGTILRKKVSEGMNKICTYLARSQVPRSLPEHLANQGSLGRFGVCPGVRFRSPLGTLPSEIADQNYQIIVEGPV